ncbi:hypothetical protein K0B96_00710 [Horticoccus luteus]|uniref:Uncharacterized protein n=1 Tax=Horticoccus luteus TaxID=2862869 RepID=A0A8F9TTV5_9BACT|nr:hypothetical protein [Horticoccus luteus]QYM79169.1 hypothetical protein K0B96_00710 [Horticoccus luteus]
MNKLVSFSAVSALAAAPAAILVPMFSGEPTWLLAGESFVAMFAAAALIFGFCADYATERRPLEAPPRAAAPLRRRNAYTFRRGAEVAQLAAPASSPLGRRALASMAG